MEGFFELGISCFGHDLYFKSDIEDAEYSRDAIASCIRNTVAVVKSDAEYHRMAKDTLST